MLRTGITSTRLNHTRYSRENETLTIKDKDDLICNWASSLPDDELQEELNNNNHNHDIKQLALHRNFFHKKNKHTTSATIIAVLLFCKNNNGTIPKYSEQISQTLERLYPDSSFQIDESTFKKICKKIKDRIHHNISVSEKNGHDYDRIIDAFNLERHILNRNLNILECKCTSFKQSIYGVEISLIGKTDILERIEQHHNCSLSTFIEKDYERNWEQDINIFQISQLTMHTNNLTEAINMLKILN